jgi:hypothetical protein
MSRHSHIEGELSFQVYGVDRRTKGRWMDDHADGHVGEQTAGTFYTPT